MTGVSFNHVLFLLKTLNISNCYHTTLFRIWFEKFHALAFGTNIWNGCVETLREISLWLAYLLWNLQRCVLMPVGTMIVPNCEKVNSINLIWVRSYVYFWWLNFLNYSKSKLLKWQKSNTRSNINSTVV